MEIPPLTEEEKKWVATGLTIALQLIPNEKNSVYMDKKVLQAYNTALKDTRKAINDYISTL